MLELIIQAGYQEALPNYLRKRVKPTNVTALLLLTLVAIPFSIITPIYFPKILILIPFSGVLTCIGVLLANQMNGIQYSRFFLSLLPVTQAALYNLFLCGPSDDPIPSIYLISLAFSLVPFVTFDFKERNALFFTSLYSFILIIAFPFTRAWFTLETNVSILRVGWLSTSTITLGILTAFGCMLGLIQISRKSEEETEEALQTTQEKNDKLKVERAENEQKTKELEAANLADKQRQWAADGLERIHEVIRRCGSESTVFDQILTFIISYLEVNQGGLFVATSDQEGQTQIRLTACYAYERKKHIEKTIAPGRRNSWTSLPGERSLVYERDSGKLHTHHLRTGKSITSLFISRADDYQR